MPFFKVTDFRVQLASTIPVSGNIENPGRTTPAYVFIDGLETSASDPMNELRMTPTRAAVMLSLFNSGRDCYWSDDPGNKRLSTNIGYWPQQFFPPVQNPPGPPNERGIITGWDVNVPLAGEVTFLLYIGHEQDSTLPTSGNPSIARAWLRSNDDGRVALALALLHSRFRYFAWGDLYNTFLSDGLRPTNNGLHPAAAPSHYLRSAQARFDVW